MLGAPCWPLQCWISAVNESCPPSPNVPRVFSCVGPERERVGRVHCCDWRMVRPRVREVDEFRLLNECSRSSASSSLSDAGVAPASSDSAAKSARPARALSGKLRRAVRGHDVSPPGKEPWTLRHEAPRSDAMPGEFWAAPSAASRRRASRSVDSRLARRPRSRCTSVLSRARSRVVARRGTPVKPPDTLLRIHRVPHRRKSLANAHSIRVPLLIECTTAIAHCIAVPR